MALVGNAFLTVIKLIASILSGSGAMLAETIHSFADTGNQGLLYLGIRRSQRPPDEDYHYGYGADRYLFALMSGAGIFVLGCGVSIYHGVHALMHPPELSLGWVTFAVLAIAFVVDGYVFIGAIKEVNAKRGETGFLRFVRETTDPTVLAVLFEDFVATFGVLVAAAGILLAYYTGDPVFDAMSSIVIGAMLGVLALWLMWRNRELILGPSIPDHVEEDAVAFLESQPSVTAVRRVRSRIVAANRFRIAAEVDYNGHVLGRRHADWVRERAKKCETREDWEALSAEFGEKLMEALGEEVDRIEGELRVRFPRIRHVDIEAD